MNKHDLGFQIKKLRERKNISQGKMAGHLEISQSKLSKIENGKIKKVDFILMEKICRFFSISNSEFLDPAFFK
ncbi:DNA-binding Xre family transcriptional regulator [Chryseobacterium sp. H1D6B]|uniref:helix-turn-helix domain-containing protein n=1 Tax=Chryseobacterium sp. H1D6B TaxID=2940588 RepID=UPI0015CEDD1D|nr:helix-turn-helix transcriptional regulator [Chryseobacterium sp. H1D6B]MDH6254248.1 DNA-binding Xre family transcriptional regulator [Chryseobacterium sp. H1D6B]